MFNRCIPILNRVAKSTVDKLRYHKISLDTLNTLVGGKYFFLEKNPFKCVTRPDLRRPKRDLDVLYNWF